MKLAMIALFVSTVAAANEGPLVRLADDALINVDGEPAGTIRAGSIVSVIGDRIRTTKGIEVSTRASSARLYAYYVGKPLRFAHQPVVVSEGDRLDVLGVDGSTARVRATVQLDRRGDAMSFEGTVRMSALVPTRPSAQSASSGAALRLRHGKIPVYVAPNGAVLHELEPSADSRGAYELERRDDFVLVSLGDGPRLEGWIATPMTSATTQPVPAVTPPPDPNPSQQPSTALPKGGLVRLGKGTVVLLNEHPVATLLEDGRAVILERNEERVRALVAVDDGVSITGWIDANAIRLK